MAMTKTFLKIKRQIIWTLLIPLMSSNILCCISLTTITSSSYNIFNYGRSNIISSRNDDDDHRRRFNKNNSFYRRATTTTVRYASLSSSSINNNNSNSNSNNREQQQFTYTSQKGDTAGHMVGSSILKRIRKNEEGVIIKRFNSFMAQWIEETGHSWPSKCSSKGCSNKPNVGAHIFIRRKNNAYLVPMCQSCNLAGMNNYVPNETIGDHWRFPIHLKEGTSCVELTHIHISKQTYNNIDNPTWLELSERFIAYCETYNSPLVPQGYKNDPQLGHWVNNQRVRYKKDGLTIRQIELLGSSGFVWDKLKYEWDENIILLVKFKQREEHCNVPKDHKEDGKNLGEWLGTQRKNKKNKTLDTAREKQLEDLGIVWDTLKYQWDENFKLLVQYKQREGNCNVPRDHEEDEKNLGVWLGTQRKNKRNKKLDNIKEKQLEELRVRWEPLSEQWDEWFTLLVKYKQREEQCNVPNDHKEDEMNLGIWLTNQRQDKKRGKLNTVKEKLLQELGAVWEPLSEQWDGNIILLVKFKDREGHCNVPQFHKEDGANIGIWLTNQRQYKKNGKLDNIKEKRLMELGVIWAPLSEQWDEWFTLLVEFRQREGHCNVPRNHKEDEMNLGQWLDNQRREKRNGKLDTVKEKELEELGAVWDLLEYRWYEWFTLLVQHKYREGHCNVPYKHKEGGGNLGIWLTRQRHDEKNGKLDTVKKKLLEELGVVWDLLEYQWDENIILLVRYKQREGHCNVPWNHKEDGMNLGTWLMKQRYNKGNGKLSEDRQHRLEEIGFVF